MTPRRGEDRQRILFGHSDMGAIWLAVFAGMGIMVLLSILGIAIGLTTIDGGTSFADLTDVGTFIGWWTIAAALIGAFVGGLLGGRSASMLGRTTPIAHGTAAWGLSMLAVLILAGVLSFNVLGSGLSTVFGVADEQTLQDTADEIAGTTGADADDVLGELETQFGQDAAVTAGQEAGDAAWWLFAFLAIALGGSIAGWFVGAMTKPVLAAAPGDSDGKARA